MPDPKARRLDAFDASNIREMMLTPAWRHYYDRLEAAAVRSRADCETASEPTEIYRAQGRAAAFTVALGLPEQILKEIKAAGK